MRRFPALVVVAVVFMALVLGASARQDATPVAGTPGTPSIPSATATCHWSLPRCGAFQPTFQVTVELAVPVWVGTVDPNVPTPIAPVDALRVHWTATAEARP